MNKLFAVYLGGKCKGAQIEVHDIAFVTGPEIKSTFRKLQASWFGIKSSVHVDSWIEVSQVDGYKVSLTKTAVAKSKAPRLYFMNIGFSVPALFGEGHNFHFMVCNSRQEAKARAKKLFSEKVSSSHVDNLIDIDDLRQIAEVDGMHVTLKKTKVESDLEVHNVYWPIKASVIKRQ
jgi:hypothetical protein